MPLFVESKSMYNVLYYDFCSEVFSPSPPASQLITPLSLSVTYTLSDHSLARLNTISEFVIIKILFQQEHPFSETHCQFRHLTPPFQVGNIFVAPSSLAIWLCDPISGIAMQRDTPGWLNKGRWRRSSRGTRRSWL